MAFNETQLANILYKSLAKTKDQNMAATNTTQFAKTYAKAVIKMLKAGILTGDCAGVGPVGASPAAKIKLVSSIMTAEMLKTFNKSRADMISRENSAVAAYIMQSSVTSFAFGSVTKSSGKKGKITKLVGTACAAKVSSAVGFKGPDMVPFYTALCKYIMDVGEGYYTSVSAQGDPGWSGTGTGSFK